MITGEWNTTNNNETHPPLTPSINPTSINNNVPVTSSIATIKEDKSKHLQ